MNQPSTDRIEKEILLQAPKKRVWHALTDAAEFGAWFGVKLLGPFVVGEGVKGQITTPGYEHLTMELTVERMEEERLFSFRWHPYAVDPKVDYSSEATTLVEFTLKDEKGDTRITVVESGFDKIPEARRAEAYRMNEGGWAAQMGNIERYVSA